MYVIVVHTKHGHTRYQFKTLDAAKRVAAEIFARTGVIVGIERC
jgi:hypothetical protein